MISLLFIRHGATKGNLEKRYIGRTDEPLCDIGIAQVLRLKNKNYTVDSVFVSPMLRTRSTADLLFPDMPYTVVEDFAEADFGIFEGRNASELSDSVEYRLWTESMCLDPIPGGENVLDFKLRCCRTFDRIIKNIPDGSSVAFVVHGGVIMSILEAYAIPERSFYEYHIGNAECIECEYDRSCIKLK